MQNQPNQQWIIEEDLKHIFHRMSNKQIPNNYRRFFFRVIEESKVQYPWNLHPIPRAIQTHLISYQLLEEHVMQLISPRKKSKLRFLGGDNLHTFGLSSTD